MNLIVRVFILQKARRPIHPILVSTFEQRLLCVETHEREIFPGYQPIHEVLIAYKNPSCVQSSEDGLALCEFDPTGLGSSPPLRVHLRSSITHDAAYIPYRRIK